MSFQSKICELVSGQALRGLGGGGVERVRKKEILHFAPYFNFTAVNSSTNQNKERVFRMTDFTREYRLKHEEIFATVSAT